MRIELKRTYPVPLKKAFDYLDDYTTWPAWYTGVLEILHPEKCAWDKPGDEVHFAYKLLGRRLEGVCTLEEIREYEFVKFMSKMPAVGIVHFEWMYEDAGHEAFTLTAVMETEEITNFFGKILDKTLIPRMLERDLRMTLDNLADTFALGIPL